MKDIYMLSLEHKTASVIKAADLQMLKKNNGKYWSSYVQ